MGAHKYNPFARGTTVTVEPVVHDQYGRRLNVGDEVAIKDLGGATMAIVEIKPNLHPAAPPNP